MFLLNVMASSFPNYNEDVIGTVLFQCKSDEHECPLLTAIKMMMNVSDDRLVRRSA